MPPLVDYFILRSHSDRAFALNGTGSNYPLPVHHMALISGDWQQQDLNRATKLGCRIFDKPTPIDTLFAWLDDLFCS